VGSRTRAAGSVIETLAVPAHPLASVAVTIYEPAANPLAIEVVCTGVVFHEYVYGAVPPAATAVAEPSLPSLHITFTWVVETVTEAGSRIVTFVFAVQPLASVTVTVYGPADRPVAVAVV
jgi:hypothetical protein